jgi:hypothetical protein
MSVGGLELSGKRSYIVPVLLLIIVVLTTMLIMVYSKLLIAGQKQTTDEGKRLAEQYLLANAFAERLSEGTDLLLKGVSIEDRLRAKRLLGEASFPSVDANSILTEAAHRSSGLPLKEAAKPITLAQNEIMSEQGGNVYGVAEHAGALTPAEVKMLQTVHSGSVKMTDALHRFRAPTGEAGFRQMAAGGDWVTASMDAAKALEEMASKLKQHTIYR